MADNEFNSQTFLEMRAVNVARGDRIVLHDINLSIRAGEHVAILGPNGCGKSTLIRTMTCELYPIIPAAGDHSQPGQPRPEISIFGRARWDPTELRKHFGVVSDTLPGLQSFNSRVPDSAGSNAARSTGLNSVLA